MCNCDCIQNPYYQDLVTQKACETSRLPRLNPNVYQETRRCDPCENRDNYKACGFPTWTQFDKVDCTFRGLNRTYGKLVPQRMMSDVMIPGPKTKRATKMSQSETRMKRVPCKKKCVGGNRGSDTQIGKSGAGAKSKNGKGTRPGNNSKLKGSKNGKKSKGKGDQSKDSSRNGDVDTNDEDGLGTDQGGPGDGTNPDSATDGGPNTGYGTNADINGMENIIRQSLMNSGILTLTPLKERDGQHYLNFNIKNQKPNPDVNLDINVDDYLFENDNKLITEIRYRLIQTIEETV